MVPELSRVREQSRLINNLIELEQKYYALRRLNHALEQYCHLTLKKLRVELRRQGVVRGHLGNLTGYAYRSYRNAEERSKVVKDPLRELNERLARLKIK